MPAIWELDKQKGLASLATVHQLAQSALEEMRALLLELRPSALSNEKLGNLIRQVATIIAKRAGLQLTVKIDRQEAVPPEVQFVIYRVVQEALNNIAHHAIGFEPEGVGIGHLGLSIMKDRIHSIGGTIETISNQGTGTLIRVRWTSTKN
jgi:signal transduction histidine kinase